MGAENVSLFSDDSFHSSIYMCRICHGEEESPKSLETPCACSGSLKFAHRGCIQRWCDEKGNITCEICLQKFEPSYTSPSKKTRLADVAVTIRESLEVPRLNPDEDIFRSAAAERASAESNYSECSDEFERGSVSYIRIIALILTVVLLMRHLVALITGEADRYAFTLFTLFALRAGGIVLPLYIMVWTVEAIRRRQLQHMHHEADSQPPEEGEGEGEGEEEEEDDDEGDEEEEEVHHHHTIEVY